MGVYLQWDKALKPPKNHMNTAEINDDLIAIMESNPILYGLFYQGCENGKTKYSEPTEYALKQVQKDYEIFHQRQRAICARKKIAEGDWVLLKNGSMSRVTVNSWNDTVQIGGTFGGSYYINSNGFAGYSGSCGDQVERANLHFNGQYKDGMCWIFSGESSGAGRGVYFVLNFKVWEER